MKPSRFEVAVLLVAAVLIVYQIFVPPLIGLADSWDFERLLRQNGLAHVSTQYSEKYFFYFNSKYRIISRSTGYDPDGLYSYKSSTSLPMRTARWLSLRAGQYQFFDIRFLAALYALIFLSGIWLILAATRSLNIILRLVLSVLLIIIFTDVGYTAYFNSFYSEATALAFLAVGVGSSLMLIARRSSSALFLICYFLAIGMIITSKPQYVPLSPAFALFGLYLSKYLRQSWRYWLSGGLAVALCCLAIWYYRQSPQIMAVQSVYIGLFMDLLPNSTTPQQDLAEIGLNPNYALYSATTPYQPDSPLNRPEFRDDFISKTNSFTLPLFYLTRPSRLYELCGRCVKHAFSTRVTRLGYYEAYTGAPGLAQPFGVWSVVRENIFPRSVPFLGFFFATAIAAFILLIKASSAALRSIYLLYILFIFIAGIQFFVAILVGGGEPDLEKHLFMFNLAFDACLILSVLGAVHVVQTFRPLFFSRTSAKEYELTDSPAQSSF